jgi:hypothetical protein
VQGDRAGGRDECFLEQRRRQIIQEPPGCVERVAPYGECLNTYCEACPEQGPCVGAAGKGRILREAAWYATCYGSISREAQEQLFVRLAGLQCK